MIHLLRHGRTAANASGLLLGRLDPPLDGEGERQAAAAARALACVVGPGGATVVSSPLARCRATAALVADAIGADGVTVDERWVELDYGDLDGVAMAQVPAATWSTWRADVEWRPPGGESLGDVGRRVRSACASLLDAAAVRDIVVVSHVSPIKAAVAWALDVGDDVSWRLFLAPASITRIAVRGGGASLHAFNEIAHLSR